MSEEEGADAPEEEVEAAPEAAPSGDGKSRMVYIILAIFMGTIGVHNFFAGHTKKAVIQLVLGIVAWVTCVVPILLPVCYIWLIIDIVKVKEDGNGVPFA
jgi:TM2 domain-containing membrane protein YozV